MRRSNFALRLHPSFLAEQGSRGGVALNQLSNVAVAKVWLYVRRSTSEKGSQG
jgi:hypothetical protein